jgi:hypothetical protein
MRRALMWRNLYGREAVCRKLKNGWKNSSGHKRRILVDKIGEFSWTLFTNSRGHFCPLEFLFWVIFRGHCFGEFSWTFLVNSRGHFFNCNDMSHTITIQVFPNLT